MQQKYLKTSETLSFACAGFGRSMIYTLMSTFLLIFTPTPPSSTPSMQAR